MQFILNIRALCAEQHAKHVLGSAGDGGQTSSHADVLQPTLQQWPHAFLSTKPTQSGCSAEGHGWLDPPALDAHRVEAFRGPVHAGGAGAAAAPVIPAPRTATPPHSSSSGSRRRIAVLL
jgi:hypothetical protein